MTASRSADRIEEHASRGPVGKSSTEVRLRHLAIVLGFTS